MQADTPLHLPISLAAYPNPLGSGMITKPPDNDIPGRQTNKNFLQLSSNITGDIFTTKKNIEFKLVFAMLEN